MTKGPDIQGAVSALLGYLDLMHGDGLLADPEALQSYLSAVRGQGRELARVLSELTVVAGVGRELGSAGATRLHEVALKLAAGRPLLLQVDPDAAEAPLSARCMEGALRPLLEHCYGALRPGGLPALRATREPAPDRLVVLIGVAAGPSVGGSTPDGTGAARALPPDLTGARLAAEAAGGSLACEPGPVFRLEVPPLESAASREAGGALRRAELAEAQALRAIQDMRVTLRTAGQERVGRTRAEAQILRTIGDLKAEHRRAVGLAERLRAAYLETVTSLARAVEARDGYTGAHIERVRRYSMAIAAARGVDGDNLAHLEFAALLHDIGKIGVPDAVLVKPGPLDPAEWEVMQRHPSIGRRVLGGVSFLQGALEGIVAHHERWDGSGYPAGLAGDEIPLFGRIIAVGDAYDAMVTDRPYRKGLPREVALAEIERGRGTQFDPDLAAAFLAQAPQDPFSP